MTNRNEHTREGQLRQLSTFELANWLKKGDSQPFLIDVRESKELDIAPFPFPVFHLPLSQFSEWGGTFQDSLPRERPIVVLCHAGIRSLNFANWLLDQSFNLDVWNLEGGIDAWSVDIDTSIARY